MVFKKDRKESKLKSTFNIPAKSTLRYFRK